MKTKKIAKITVIGVGASAGGMEALQELLQHIPVEMDNAAMIIAQHLSATYKSRLADLLRKNTIWNVVEATDGQMISSKTIYITPPDTNVEVIDSIIRLSNSENSPKPSIDFLFQNLAKQYQEKAVGVVLSGTGSDGTLGAKAIKEAGGYMIAQEPATAKYDAMPKAVIASENVDWVLPASQIADEVYHLLQDQEHLSIRYHQNELPLNSLQQVLKILSKHTGTDFSNYKTSTILRRLEKHITFLGLKNIEEYLALLEEKPQELDALLDTILIGVTSFFRDKEAFEKLEIYIAKIIHAKKKNDTIRIWVAGCATGEEPYSIAIILYRLLKEHIKDYTIQIFATDIDETSIMKARKGVYAIPLLANIPKDIIEECFTKRNNEYTLNKNIRNMVMFSRHDLTNNPPFLRLDLISCRNLLIYFDTTLQKQVIPIFHYSLNAHGYLFLGKSETIGGFTSLFSIVEPKAKIFQHKRTQQQLGIKIRDAKPVKYSIASPTKTLNKKNSIFFLENLVKDTICHHFEHPYVVVNDLGDIQEIKGNMNQFLALPEGTINTNITKLVLVDLRIELRTIFNKAVKEKTIFKSRIKKIKSTINSNHDFIYIRMSVIPLLFTEKDNEFLIISFETINMADYEELLQIIPNGSQENNAIATQDQQQLVELEHELTITKEQLQDFIEELESNNEDLQFTNEELQSTNEELQASNEELETSNEELQASNEEVEVAYSELKISNENLEKADTLLKISENNLFAILNNSVKGYCLIDKDYKIILYNPAFEALCNNISQRTLSIGSVIIDYIPTKSLESFYKNLSDVFLSKTAISNEYKFSVFNKKYYYIINFTPIIDFNKEVKNISIGILDNTPIKELNTKLQESEALFSSIFYMADIGICITDENGFFVNVNQEYCRIYGYKREEIINKHFTEFLPKTEQESATKIHKQFFLDGFLEVQEWQVIQKTGELVNIQIEASLLKQQDGKKLQIVSITDITQSTKYKYLLEKTENSLHIGGWNLDLVTGEHIWTKELHDIYDTPSDYNLSLDNMLTFYEEPYRTQLEKSLESATKLNKVIRLELQFTSFLRVKKWIILTLNPTIVDNQVVKLYGIIQDITSEKEQAEKLLKFQKQYQLLANNLHDVIFTTDNNLKFTFITPSVLRMYGYTEEEFMKLEMKDYLSHDSIEVAKKAHQKRLKLEAEHPSEALTYVNILEVEPIRKDGSTFWTEVLTTSLYDENGQKIGYVGTIRDITVRKQQEDELKKLFLVTSKTENVIIITNNKREIEWVNEAFVKTTGYSFEEVVGKTPQFLQGRETSSEHVKIISESLQSKKSFAQEILNYTKSGDKYWVELNVTPILNENGEVEKFFAIQNNVTARKITEQQLRDYADKQYQLTEDLTRQNNDLRQFSYILSHNIRSYVANILGIVGLIEMNAVSADEYDSFIKMLHKAANGLDTVIRDLNDILDVRRPFNKQIEKILLPEIISEVTQTLQNQIDECHAIFEYDLEVTEIIGVKPYVQSIFYNLISNAIKYRADNRVLEVFITSKHIDDKVVITIKDNGLGIDLIAQKDSVFSLYKRFHTHTAGKGLGLFMVKTQIEAMGGKIAIESAVNKGSVFTVTLPINF